MSIGLTRLPVRVIDCTLQPINCMIQVEVIGGRSMDNTIVVGVDATDDSLAALAAAARLAEESEALLLVVHVRHESWMVSAAVMEPAGMSAMTDTLDAVEKATREQTAAFLAERNLRWRLAVARGDPATELIAAAHG